MIHTYEVWVDIKEYLEQTENSCRSETSRYEIDAESRLKADGAARNIARLAHPKATEYDVRITRLLR